MLSINAAIFGFAIVHTLSSGTFTTEPLPRPFHYTAVLLLVEIRTIESKGNERNIQKRGRQIECLGCEVYIMKS